MKTFRLYFVFLGGWLFVLGCVTTPEESVTLSEDLTAMIIPGRDAHLLLIEEYFNEKRQQAERFIEQEWTPDYLDDFIKTSGVLKDLSRGKTPEEKQKILSEFTVVAIKEINNRRDSLLDILDKIENKLSEKSRSIIQVC